MVRQHFGTAAVPLSPAVRAGDFVHVSGQVPVREGVVIGTTIEEQTGVVLENVGAALALAGCTLADVVRTNVILADRGDFAPFNEAYAAFFPQDPPARTTIEARLMIDIRVEIDAIAYRPL